MNDARYDHRAVLLDDGRVLVTGGRNDTQGDSLGSAEIFDPKAAAWRRAAPMRQTRDAFALARLPDGRVLAAAGYGAVSGKGTALAEAEIYSPDSDAWQETAPLDEPRTSPAVATLPDGRIYLAGGSDDGRALQETVVFDPLGGTWRPLTPLLEGNEWPRAVALADGRVLIAGGYQSGRMLPNAELEDPATGKMTKTGSIGETRYAHALVRTGRFIGLLGGEMPGRALSSTSVFEPATLSWRSGPQLSTGRAYAVAIPLDESRVLLAGGGLGNAYANNTSEIVDLAEQPDVAAPKTTPAIALTAQPPQAQEHPSLRFASKGPQRPDDYAVVVGVDRYKSLPDAEFAESDARDMTAALEALGVPEENVVVLSGARATLSEVSKYVEEWLPRRVSKDSRVYFYFSGHGAPDVSDGTAYLMPWDADAAFVKSTGFPLSRLYQALGELHVTSVVAVIDACFSGAGGRSVLAPGLRPLVTVRLPKSPPPRVAVLAAAESEEVAGSLPERGHGLFSYYVLKGLSGAADAKDAGHLTLRQLHAYVRKHVILDARRQNREQTPTLTAPNPSLELY